MLASSPLIVIVTQETGFEPIDLDPPVMTPTISFYASGTLELERPTWHDARNLVARTRQLVGDLEFMLEAYADFEGHMESMKESLHETICAKYVAIVSR